MLGSDTLDVAIGLIFFFLTVSLIGSAILEGIEAILKVRARDLERGIRELLDDPAGNSLAKSVFEHGQVFSLFAGDYVPAKLGKGLFGKLVGTLSLGKLDWGKVAMPWWHRRNLPSYVPTGQFAAALMDVIARGESRWPFPVDPGTLTTARLREKAGRLPNDRVRRAVLSAIDTGGDDLWAIKANIERWYDGSMDRVSGWYKRRSHGWLFAIGLLMAALLNLDAITVAQHLVNDKALRTAFVAQAEATSKQGVPAKDVKALRAQLEDLGTPIGWSRIWVPGPQSCKPVQATISCDAKNVAWFWVILGWVLTALAITMGAPFWFDLLNKFMIVRSTVKPHEKSQEAGSEDRQPRSASDSDAQPPEPGLSPAEQPIADAALEIAGLAGVGPPEDQGFEPETWQAGLINPKEIVL